MPFDVQLIQPDSTQEWHTARCLVEEYAASLEIDLSFQQIDHELQHLETEYSQPTGAFLLAQANNVYLGCVGLRQFSPDTGEIKRLYLLPEARGTGLGRMLAEVIIERGREIGYKQLVLDTLPSMQKAQALYQSLGFSEIPPYRYNPVEGTKFLALDLTHNNS